MNNIKKNKTKKQPKKQIFTQWKQTLRILTYKMGTLHHEKFGKVMDF